MGMVTLEGEKPEEVILTIWFNVPEADAAEGEAEGEGEVVTVGVVPLFDPPSSLPFK